MEHAIARGANERVNIRSSIPFSLLQALPLLAFVTGVTTTALALLMVTFFGRFKRWRGYECVTAPSTLIPTLPSRRRRLPNLG
jgi:hypothetical protein